MKTLIKNVKVVLRDEVINGAVLTEGGKICTLLETGDVMPDADKVVDAKGQYLAPGFVEIHTHGAGGRDFMDGKEDIMIAAKTYMQHGATTVLPTTVA